MIRDNHFIAQAPVGNKGRVQIDGKRVIVQHQPPNQHTDQKRPTPIGERERHISHDELGGYKRSDDKKKRNHAKTPGEAQFLHG